ncbi:hypothetical protein ACH47B_13155 [Rhodococcus sp. NPDC019627]|uniref:hypothetical protein n=1 Tax=unclassified Rhodococcus (in: high G+C Gram-positive bacteria) TaxID=192944 RepID=UPI0033D133E3
MSDAPDYEKAFYKVAGLLQEVEEHCRMRVQDWGDRAAQEVLDCINREGEWAE